MRYMNWKTLISEIQAYGNLTQSAVGEACGTTQSTISSLVLREGSEPSYSLGAQLKELHRKVSRKSNATSLKKSSGIDASTDKTTV